MNPAKAKPSDPSFTFEMAQDEIGQASGALTKNTKNMTQGAYIFSFV